MLRRTFNAAIAGGMLLPRLLIKPENDLHGLLAQWVNDPNEPIQRYDLREPYVRENHAYATDACAMARIVSTGPDADADKLRIPEFTVELWESYWTDDGKWRTLPKTFKTAADGDGYCYRCVKNECSACGGYGGTYYGSTYGYCKRCNGCGHIRKANCPLCHGRHDIPVPSEALFAGNCIALEYADRLREVPGVYWRPGIDKGMPVLWRSDIGICGMIMPRVIQ